MNPTTLQHDLGLRVEPRGTAGQLLVLSPTGVPLFVLTPHGAVGGQVRYSVSSVLDLAVLAVRRVA